LLINGRTFFKKNPTHTFVAHQQDYQKKQTEYKIIMNTRITKPSASITGIFAVAVMAVLILFSSCTVRKSFQNFLEIPVTKSLNVNKAVVTNSSACHAALTETKINSKISNPYIHDFIFGLDKLSSQLFPSGVYNMIPVLAGANTTEQLPYYILYEQMKIFN